MPALVLHRDTGFTLIELLITIAILALIAGVAVPIYNGYRNEALISRAINDIRQIEILISDYRLDGRTLPATLAEVGVNWNDPWGQAYRYLAIDVVPPPSTGKTRKDKNLVPINTDFDLYSIGPDGRTATPLTSANSRDDIVRAANGAFIGLGIDY